MNKKIGFIGCGNMGHAILKGIIDSGLCNVSDVFVSARTKETLEKIRNELAVNVCSNIEVAQKSDILFIAVKPNIFKSIIDEIKSFVSNETIIVSIEYMTDYGMTDNSDSGLYYMIGSTGRFATDELLFRKEH